MAMIGIGVAILTVAYRGANGKARMACCLSNTKQLGLSARMYMQDNEGRMPSPPRTGRPNYEPPDYYYPQPGMDPGMDSWMEEDPAMSGGPRIGGWEICEPLMVYVKNQQVFRCSMAPRRERPPEYEGNTWYQVDYMFNLSARTDDPPTTILVSDDASDRHPGRPWNAVRVDGAGVRLRADRWDEFWAPGPDGYWPDEGMMDDEPPCCP